MTRRVKLKSKDAAALEEFFAKFAVRSREKLA